MTVLLMRRYGFAAAHRLYIPALSDDENTAIYGKCANPYGHGHDYELELVVRGKVDEVTGRVVDLARLDALTEETVLRQVRYKDLNAELEAFRTAPPTTENLAREVERWLRAAWPKWFGRAPALEMIRIRETPRNICEVSAS